MINFLFTYLLFYFFFFIFKIILIDIVFYDYKAYLKSQIPATCILLAH